ncbi:putative ribonuclease H-like domain-containing protein [Tanacetum coccineum]
MTQKLGNGFEFKKKACFVCGSVNHLIKDCNFYENKMVGKYVLNNEGKVTGQREVRPVWNNAQRVNHQNKLTHPHPRRNFVPSVVITNSGKVPVNTTKQSFSRAAISNSTARDVNTVASRQTVNGKVSIAKVNNVTTAGPKAVVSAAEGNGENVVKSSACWIWIPTRNGNPQYTLQDQAIFDYGCSRYMIGNKFYLSYYQDINGGFSSEDEVGDDARKKHEVLDPVKEGDINGQGEAADTNSTNRLNIVRSSVNTVSPTFTTMDPGQKRTQRNEFKSVFGQEKDAHGNSTYMIFTPVSAAGSFYDNIGRSITINAATLPNGDLPTDPLMPELEDTADLHDTSIFSGAYDDEDVGAEADLNNLETTMNRLVDLPKGKHAIGTKWVYRNKKDERGIVVRNKARLVAQGYTQEEGIEYDEVFAACDRIDAIKLILWVEKALYGLHQSIRAWYETLSTYLLENGFRRGFIDKTLFIKKSKGDILLVQVYVDDIIFGSTKKSLCIEFESLMHKKFQMSSMGELTFFLQLQVIQRNNGIFISQDKYVADILKKFYFSLINDWIIDVLTAFRPDIMFAVCACARFQVTHKVSHLYAVKRIFRYLKGQLKLGLWYLRDLPFDLEAFSDSDYAGASLNRKSTIGAEYVAIANCCGHVLWIQNQMLDYGFNFMNTKIYIDNESAICIVKNPVFHSKTKHIEIRHHFVRDSYKKKLIQLINVADLLTEAFDEVEIPQSNFPTQTPVADEVAFTGVNVVHGGAATTKLEQTIQTSQDRRRAKIMVSDDEEDEEDPSKQGRKVTTADAELNTASTFVSTASSQRHTDTTAETLMEIRKSAAKIKGKAIMLESEQPKKIKKRIKIQMSLDEELAQTLHEEAQARFNAELEAEFDAEVAQKLQEELDAVER